MTFQEFLTKWNGQYCEVAGSANAQNQCVDLANAYIRDVLGLPIIEWTNAKDFPSKGGEPYTYILNTPTGVPSGGDLVIWGGTYGHIAIFIEGNANTFTSFDQNYPVGSPCHVQGHTYANVLGWMHPKTLPQVDQECMPKSQAEDFRRVKEGWNQLRAKLNVEDSVTVVLANIDKFLTLEEALRKAEKKNVEDLEEIRKFKDQAKTADDKYKELKDKIEKVLSDVNIAITDNAGVLGALDELEKRVSTPVVVKDKPWYIQVLEFFSKKVG